MPGNRQSYWIYVLPACGQEELPWIRHTVPAVAAKGALTEGHIEFLATGAFTFRSAVQVRVTDQNGILVELAPVANLHPPRPVRHAELFLNTGSYAPWTYRVRAEFAYLTLDRKAGMATSVWTTLIVPPPASGLRPEVRHSVPSVAAADGPTRFEVEFSLPSGFRLARGVRVYLTRPDDDQPFIGAIGFQWDGRNGKGFRDLDPSLRAPGSYKIRAEVQAVDSDGNIAWWVSPWTTFVIPLPSPKDRLSIRHAAPARAIPNARTPISVQFSVPEGCRVGEPWIEVTAEDRLAGIIPIVVTRGAPEGSGRAELPAEEYVPGDYRVRAGMYVSGRPVVWGHFVYSEPTIVRVLPPALAEVAVSQESLSGGASTSGTVRLSGTPAPEGAMVRLASSRPDLVSVPGSVQATARTTSFDIVTRRVTETTRVTISAAYNGLTKRATLTLLPVVQGIAMFRAGTWYLRDAITGETTEVAFGTRESLPIPADYTHLSSAQIAVYDPSARRWRVRMETGGEREIAWGEPGDVPVPGDYLGLGHAQIAAFRPSLRTWFLRHDDGKETAVPFGDPQDRPVPGEYTVRGRTQMALFRPQTGDWFLRGEDGRWTRFRWGARGDVPVPGDYLGLGRAQIAVFRPKSGLWLIRDDRGRAIFLHFGRSGDVPVPFDYLGLGHPQLALFRPSTSEWLIRRDDGRVITVQWGVPGGLPVPANYRPRFGLP